MNADDLVLEVRANGISTAQLSDDNLGTLIGGILRTYNRYRPRCLHSTITTVAHQGEYDVDADATKVLQVCWDPSDTTDVVSRVLSELRLVETDFYYPSMLEIFHVNKSALRKYTSGTWRMIGSQVSLIPVPDTDDSIVPYLYAANWERLEDIPLADEDLLVEGAVASANLSVARTRAGSSGWQAGDYRVDGTSASNEVKRAEDALLGWRIKLAGGAVGGRS